MGDDLGARDPHREPIHPGVILAKDVLPDLNMSVATAAKHMGITRQALARVLDGKAAVSPEMALRIGKFCGNGGELWLRMQAAHDLWRAERALKDELARIPTQRAA